MLKPILISLFSLALFAAKITSVEGSYATITPTDARVGSSGIVVHRFDEEHSTIVARAILTDKDRIKFEVFDALAQPNLPKPKILPQKGDEVIIPYLYDRGVIIAPNYETYKKIEERFYDTRWLHPDLFAVELSKARHKTPNREDFKNFCNKYAAAKVVIALRDEAAVVDCYSFKKVDKFPIKIESNNTKFPFYMRIKEIEGGIFSLFSNDEEDYFNYYKKLLEER